MFCQAFRSVTHAKPAAWHNVTNERDPKVRCHWGKYTYVRHYSNWEEYNWHARYGQTVLQQQLLQDGKVCCALTPCEVPQVIKRRTCFKWPLRNAHPHTMFWILPIRCTICQDLVLTRQIHRCIKTDNLCSAQVQTSECAITTQNKLLLHLYISVQTDGDNHFQQFD